MFVKMYTVILLLLMFINLYFSVEMNRDEEFKQSVISFLTLLPLIGRVMEFW